MKVLKKYCKNILLIIGFFALGIDNLRSPDTFSQDEKIIFKKKIDRILSMIGSAVDVASTSASLMDLMIFVSNNQMQGDVELAEKIALITKQLGSLAPDTIVDYSVYVNNFGTGLVSLSSSTLDAFVSNFKLLVDKKVYATNSDISTLIDKITSDEFQANPVIATQGGLAKLQDYVKPFLNPISFLEHYNVFQDLVRRASLPNSTLSQYSKDVLKDKLKILSVSGGNLYLNNISYDTVRIAFGLLEQKTSEIFSKYEGYFNDKADLLTKIQSGINNQKSFSIPYSTRVKNEVIDLFSQIQTGKQAIVFVDNLKALMTNRVEASASDLGLISSVINQAMYNDVFTSLYDRAVNNTNTQTMLSNMNVQFSSEINNSERAAWLLWIFNSRISPAQHHPNLIIKIFTDLISNIDTDPSANQSLPVINTACNRALATTFVSIGQSSQIQTLNNSLQSIIMRQSGAQLSSQVRSIQQLVSAIDNNPNNLKDVFRELELSVNNKAALSDIDIKTLTQILQSLIFNKVFIESRTLKYSNDETFQSLSSRLTALIQKPSTFIEQFNDLQTFLNNMDLSEVSKKSFLTKMQKTIALKTEDLVKATDDEGDKLYAFITLLNSAAATKMASKQQEVLAAARNLVTYRSNIQAGLPVPFILKMNQLRSLVPNTGANVDIGQFVALCNDLLKNRVQGTKKQLLDLQAWLKSTDVLNNQSIFRSGKQANIIVLADALIQPIDAMARYNELKRMINQYGIFSGDQKVEFYSKLSDLMNLRSSFGAASLDKNLVASLISYAKTSIYLSDETFVDEDSNSKSYFQELYSLKTILDQNAISKSTDTYAAELVKIKDSLELIGNSKESAQVFVDKLRNLIGNLVDALPADEKALRDFLDSSDLQNNMTLYTLAGNKNIADELKKGLSAPISYDARANNLINFSRKLNFTDADKEVFVAKTQQLLDNRADAFAAKYDLSQLQTLINIVVANRFDANSDKLLIDKLKNISTSIVMPIDVGPQNYDFEKDIVELIESFSKVKDSQTLNNFISKIKDVLTRKVNAIFVLDSDEKDQAQILYDGMFLSPSATSSRLNVNQNDYIYFNPANKKAVFEAAASLNEPSTFAEMFANLQNLVKNNSVFDSSMAEIFIKLVKKMIKRKDLAEKESINKQEVVDLFAKAKMTRVGDIPTQGRIADLITEFNKSDTDANKANDYQNKIFTKIFASLIANFFPGVKSPENITTSPSFSASVTVASFVSSVESIVANRADATELEFKLFAKLINNNVVANNYTLVSDQNGQSKLKFDAAVAQMNSPLPYSDLANNLITMILTLQTFNDTDKARFKNKLTRLVSLRADGYASGFDMSNLVNKINIVLATQMQNDPYVTSQLASLQIIPKPSASDPWRSFVFRVTDKKNKFDTFSTSPNDKLSVSLWVKELSSLVEDRVDGIIYDVSKKIEDRSALSDFEDFLDGRVRYHDLVINTDLETLIDSYLEKTVKPVLFSELVSNLQKTASVSSYFSSEHSSSFVNKLDRIKDRKYSAKPEQLKTIIRMISAAKDNRYQSAGEGAFLIAYRDAINTAPTSAEISFATNAEAAMPFNRASAAAAATTAAPAGLGQAPDVDPDSETEALDNDVKAVESININVTVTDSEGVVWLQKIKPVVAKLQIKLGQYSRLGKPYSDLAKRAMLVINSLVNRTNRASIDEQIKTDLRAEAAKLQIITTS